MHPLIEHIQKMVPGSDPDPLTILPFFDTLPFRKKELLLEEGKRCNDCFFVMKGCLRLFYTDDSGIDQTLQFALENWWMTDLDAFKAGKNTRYSIQALEPAEVLCISHRNYEQLLQRTPVMEAYFRRVYERAYAASLLRIQLISRMPKQEFYENFESKYPDFLQRIPQKILASFLGFTPEYLSELRRNRKSKKK